MLAVATRDLTVSYRSRRGTVRAIDGLTLAVDPGAWVALLGANGSGKSTLLRTIAGLGCPDAGTVSFDTAARRPRARIGMVFQTPALDPLLTVQENLQLAARISGLRGDRTASIRTRVAAAALTDRLHQRVDTLSGGLARRVDLVRALLHDPDLLLLDEPTVGLDPIQIREIRKLITELGESHTVILSSHILSEIQATCSRVMIINQGQIVFDQDLADMHADARPDMLLLAFSNPPELGELSAMPGIGQVREIGGGRLRAECDSDVDPRELLVRASIENNWGLLEMAREAKTLEEMFVELTSRDDSANINKEAA